MIIPVRCFTCGNILASKYEKYRYLKAKQKQINEILLIDNFKNIQNENENSAICNELMKQVGLKRYCCKRHFLGQLNILEYI